MKEKTIIIIVALVVVSVGFLYLNKLPTVNNSNINTVTSKEIVKNTPQIEKKEIIASSKKSVSLGEYLTDTKDMTLYVSALDKRLQSSCVGDCLKTWPPFMYDNKNIASSTDMISKRMNVIKRSDGSFQYAYGEKPVYYYVGDKNPGDTNGNGLGSGKWSVVIITK